MKQPARRTQIACVLVGLMAVAGGLVLLVKTALFVDSSELAMGRVTGSETMGRGKSRFTSFIVSFEDERGTAHEARTRSGSPFVNYVVGESVEVLYSRADASQARVATPFELWGTPLVFCAFGIGIALFGGSYMLEAHRRKPRLG